MRVSYFFEKSYTSKIQALGRRDTQPGRRRTSPFHRDRQRASINRANSPRPRRRQIHRLRGNRRRPLARQRRRRSPEPSSSQIGRDPLRHCIPTAPQAQDLAGCGKLKHGNLSMYQFEEAQPGEK